MLTAVGLAGVTWALIEAGERGATGAALAAGAAGLAALAGFVAVERRARHPMLPLDIFRSRQFTAANLVTFAVYASLGITFFLLVVNLQQVLGYSPMQAGLATLPVTALMLALSARAGLLADRIGPRLPMTVGPLGIAAGLALLSRVQEGTTYLGTVLPGLVVFGLGLTLTVRPSTATVLAAAADAPCRHRLGRQQRGLAGRGAHRDRGDSRARRSDRARLSRPGRFRDRFSHGHAYQRCAGRRRWGARVAAHPQRACRPRRPVPGRQARSPPLLRGRRRAAGHRARRRRGDALRGLTLMMTAAARADTLVENGA